ncbi:MAG: deoxyribonuclease V [Gammaproteobacteria bacterium]|nr:deoxyribonuclease V [Gammaproteobacteria bacterium]
MPNSPDHTWDLSPTEARELQMELCDQVVTLDKLTEPKTVAGVDVGFEAQGRITRAAVAVLSFPDLIPVEQAIARQPTRFPYVPGLLSFREIPAVLAAMQKLHRKPDMLLCDGQGRAHPRRFGLACHLGLLTDTPSIGVAKSRLIGTHGDLPQTKGSSTPLLDGQEIIGAVLRTRDRVNPLYISIGHRISLETAIHYVLACTTRYKLPETTRAAHNLASN